MRRIPVVIVSALILTALVSAQQAAPQAKPPAASPASAPLVFRNQIVIDQQGLGLEVFRMLIPKDWSFNGGVNWSFAKPTPEALIFYTAALGTWGIRGFRRRVLS